MWHNCITASASELERTPMAMPWCHGQCDRKIANPTGIFYPRKEKICLEDDYVNQLITYFFWSWTKIYSFMTCTYFYSMASTYIGVNPKDNDHKSIQYWIYVFVTCWPSETLWTTVAKFPSFQPCVGLQLLQKRGVMPFCCFYFRFASRFLNRGEIFRSIFDLNTDFVFEIIQNF